MGISGRSIEKDISKEEMVKLIYDCYGRIKEMASRSHCSRQAIYDYIDVYPELQQVRKKASQRFFDIAMETSQEVLNKLLDRADDDPNNANKAAQFVLKNAKDSPYNTDMKRGEEEDEKESADRLISCLSNQLNS